MTRKLHIDLDELIIAFDTHIPGAEFYLNTKTGEILPVTEDGRYELERLSPQAKSLEHLEELIKQKLPAGIQDEVITLARFEAEEDDYILVPTTPSYAGYQDMEDFIQTVNNVALQNMLQEAIQGKGAFRRFKDTLNDAPEERERWFKFSEAAMEQRIREWLEENDIEPI